MAKYKIFEIDEFQFLDESEGVPVGIYKSLKEAKKMLQKLKRKTHAVPGRYYIKKDDVRL